MTRLAGCARRGYARLDVPALLRPIADVWAQNRVRDLILQAYAEYEEQERGAPHDVYLHIGSCRVLC